MARTSLWYPPEGQADLLDWWRPLLAACRAARENDAPWSVDIDEFELRGRVDRPGYASIWVYRHRVTGGELYIDLHANAYRFIPTPRGRSAGRFVECEFAEAAMRAQLPMITRSRPSRYDDDDDDDDDGYYGPRNDNACAEMYARAERGSASARAPAGRRHLTVVRD